MDELTFDELLAVLAAHAVIIEENDGFVFLAWTDPESGECKAFDAAVVGYLRYLIDFNVLGTN